MARAVYHSIRRFLKDEDGPTAVEYAVLTMLILLVVISTVQFLGQLTAGSLEDSRDKIEQAMNLGS